MMRDPIFWMIAQRTIDSGLWSIMECRDREYKRLRIASPIVENIQYFIISITLRSRGVGYVSLFRRSWARLARLHASRML